MDNTILDIIDKKIKSNSVILFMKGTPESPQCGFSATVCKILEIMGINFSSVNVLQDQSIRQGIKDYSNWPTIPQLYIKGKFIGGCDIVREMYENGELEQLFNDNNIKAADNIA